MFNSTVQAPINATEQYYIPVVEKMLNNIIKAMRKAGIEWDSTINQIDEFMKTEPAIYWNWHGLTPRKGRKTKNVVFVLYVVS
ncbi:hypothetical protein [Nostoc sp. ChiSLP03a]|uniref:hypothetical protein n=1 Tax=Nostoc sp. ChiSLP03a TaxID=3075380 RepID=UPI002AD24770|nr:hypothetical protein [Nostoc sp. ChiSLP03a]MDZ8211333.1 hypothetical protein [Nostoc sp. ChiSLP03a]